MAGKRHYLLDKGVKYSVHPYTNLALFEQTGRLGFAPGVELRVCDGGVNEYRKDLAGFLMNAMNRGAVAVRAPLQELDPAA